MVEGDVAQAFLEQLCASRELIQPGQARKIAILFSSKFQKAFNGFLRSGIDPVECGTCIDGDVQIVVLLKIIEFGVQERVQNFSKQDPKQIRCRDSKCVILILMNIGLSNWACKRVWTVSLVHLHSSPSRMSQTPKSIIILPSVTRKSGCRIKSW
jgi:hypothetical protein